MKVFKQAKISALEQSLDPSLVALQLGVWRAVSKRGAAHSKAVFKSFHESFIAPRLKGFKDAAYAVQFLVDVYHLAPLAFILFAICHLLSGVDVAVKLYFSNKLMKQIQIAVTSGSPDVTGIATSLAVHVSVTLLAALWFWLRQQVRNTLESKITIFCRDRVMRAHLNLDLLSAHDSSNVMDMKIAFQAHHCLRSIFDVSSSISSAMSQIFVVANLMKTQENSLILAILCLAYPVMINYSSDGFYEEGALCYINDASYRRLLVLFDIATRSRYRQDVISGGIRGHVATEFGEISKSMGDITDGPDSIFDNSATPWRSCVGSFLHELPLIYYIIQAIRNPQSFSLTFLATLQQMTGSIRESVMRLVYLDQSLWENLRPLKTLYDDSRTKLALHSGTHPFPPTDKSPKDGMAVRFCNVNFKYPGSKDDQIAVRDVSFSIPASSLVVIVGANGSGKSSIVKLLTQLYRPTSGDIIIDDHEVSTYRLDDLYQAIALLTQEHAILPVSVAENIGLGDPTDVDNMKKIQEAARCGGSHGFIQKLEYGYDEELSPLKTSYRTRPLDDGPLKKLSDDIERIHDISGGEKQRLAASRTFMRLFSDKIKLVVVDEPTSAMDPTGEFELFEQLRSMRSGKTMVFVTHRFGHLTKHADLILCMKEGRLMESGTHRELMQKSGGEYSKLYDIQARAFTDDAAPACPAPS